MKFFSFFLVSAYILGVFGMEIFYEAEKIPELNKFSVYRDTSNFSYFLGTQLIFMQVLTEAGWSFICFDYV